jgi:hypothetical protein
VPGQALQDDNARSLITGTLIVAFGLRDFTFLKMPKGSSRSQLAAKARAKRTQTLATPGNNAPPQTPTQTPSHNDLVPETNETPVVPATQPLSRELRWNAPSSIAKES